MDILLNVLEFVVDWEYDGVQMDDASEDCDDNGDSVKALVEY